MNYTVSEVLEFVEDHDVKFIRLAFCDIFGNLKNIAIQAGELKRVLEHGASFDASAVKGFMNIEESDLLLFPDLSTLAVLPWRPQQGRVIRFYCDIKHPNGKPFEGDGRYILKSAIQRAAEKGYVCKIGAECEFYLFEQDAMGNPTKIPHDHAGYLDVAPLDKGENVRREICFNLEEMGVVPESSHHEQGPGQNEIDFRYSDALEAADDLITFKSVVKTIASLNGLHASFMPKPLHDKSGNGLHINLSLSKNGKNIFKSAEQKEHSKEAESFIAGILRRVDEITAFLNPLTNSYKRFGSFEAPAYLTWSHQNRSQLIRIPAAVGENVRMELRSPDPSCNPYLVYALLISAGLEGIEENLTLCPPTDMNLYRATEEELEGIKRISKTLLEAVEKAQKSSFVDKVLPQRTKETFLTEKRREWYDYHVAVSRDGFEAERYFSVI
jgi:glutamine synthetase